MPPRETELRVGGLRLWARFTLLMTLALTLVMAAAGFFLYQTATRLTATVHEQTLVDTARAMAEVQPRLAEIERLRNVRDQLFVLERRLPAEGTDAEVAAAARTLREEMRQQRERADADLRERSAAPPYRQVGTSMRQLDGGRVRSALVEFGDGRRGELFQVSGGIEQRPAYELLVPARVGGTDQGLLGLIVGTTILVVLIGAAVSVFVANQVSGPLEDLVSDIRQISTGDLSHRTHVRVGGELALLARAIDRMTRNLAEAQETKLTLSIRDRELEVASEVREALLPQTTPRLEGYELGAAHLSSNVLWGDFHDLVELDRPGHVGLLVCDVSSKGLPGALVGATARSYLRSHLAPGRDLRESLLTVNRELARDVRRGMFVTALYVQVDASAATATVACAGHKIPLVRYSAADGKVRLIQPEGIALAFDKGPVFERALQVQQVPLEPGDRLVLVNTGAVSVAGAEGVELGEKPLYGLILKHAALPTATFLARVRAGLERHAGGQPLERDVSIVTVARG